MKNKIRLLMIFLSLLLILSACQTAQEKSPEEETIYLPQSASGSGNQTNQDDEGYPVQNDPVSQLENAYPISTDDLQLLNRSWFLYGYSENGTSSEPVSKTITFSGDAFEITIEESTSTGTWTARINSPNPILVFNIDNESTLIYEIIELSETNLVLQTARDQSQIVEEYIPVD